MKTLTPLVVLLGLLSFLAGWSARGIAERLEREPAARASFMLECVADWQYTPETCEGILEGEPPPPQPDALGEPGC